MTQKRGGVHLRPSTHLLLDKISRKMGKTKTQIIEEAVRQYEMFTPEGHLRREK